MAEINKVNIDNVDYDIRDTSKSTATNLENGTGDGALKQMGSESASGDYSFATGRITAAYGEASHVEGLRTVAEGSASHAEGGHYDENGRSTLGIRTITVDGTGIDGINGSKAVGVQSHAEGTQTYAGGYGAHAEGQWTVANGNNSHAEGLNSQAIGENSHAEGNGTIAEGDYSHAEGYSTKASKKGSHAEGYNTKAFGNATHAEGGNLDKQGNELPAWEFTDKDGEIILINGSEAYAPGSHAEGTQTYAADYSSHAEGLKTVAEGDAAHAEGSNTIARGNYSHSEGLNTTASGPSSHAEGDITIASGTSSHAEGGNTVASGFGSHAEGDYTIAASSYQHAQGKFNIEDNVNTYAHIVGNGSSSARSNAHTLDWSGNAWFAGDVYVGSTSGTNKDEGSVKLAKELINITLPAGLMKGDLNKNGVIDAEDERLAFKCAVNDFGDLTFEEAKAIGDLDGDGYVDSSDTLQIRMIIEGRNKLGFKSADTLGNWTINPNYETEKAQFYTDISLSTINEDNSVVLIVTDDYDIDFIDRVECYDGYVRVYATLCPIREISCAIMVNGAGNTTFIHNPSEVFLAKYNITTYGEIFSAHASGKRVFLTHREQIFSLNNVNESELQFISVIVDENTNSEITLISCFNDDSWDIYDVKTMPTVHASTHASDGSDPITPELIGAQAKITGTTGQVIGFDTNGNAVAQEAPAGAKVYNATIGTSWIEDENTGVKSQTVSIQEITSNNTAKVDVYMSHNPSSEGLASFVEEQNQFLDYITNGYAETINGGIKFYIFGDANTVNIPIVVEVV